MILRPDNRDYCIIANLSKQFLKCVYRISTNSVVGRIHITAGQFICDIMTEKLSWSLGMDK